MRLKHLDLAEGVLWQDGREVRTKFAKTFSTWFFPVGGEAVSIVTDWVEWLRQEHWGDDDPLFPATQVALGENGGFVANGVARHGWSTAAPIRAIFHEACAAAQIRYFNPHSLRDMLALFGEKVCKTPEQFKAWSQNLGHERMLTTWLSYGTVPPSRQAEIMRELIQPDSGDEFLRDPHLKALLMQLARRATG